ncbi:hypothetical protein E2C01_010087 [Portunus trituberculatus]|uniref:Uncharacterized protein n=1 Tax=Portunus trituberculatus TaxID=210409 RepID=A0A5B7D7G4_PORTR|nr:hypothetical protein [Portunus trituberculatus]
MEIEKQIQRLKTVRGGELIKRKALDSTLSNKAV